ncbi:hypothetical protein C2S51_018546 [Perilla frutescens var. frutescens]|nr:hypothetical protein C2S51_018546 [Perilla frutescens var. frutescens]
MPKDRRVNSSSFDRSMVSPYSCSSKIADCKNGKRSLHHVGDEKEWEDVRCPICMEQPHNAVLLLCSSREKGCRPFLCDTSYRHSNCFDQFKRSSAAANLHTLSDEQQSDELVCPFCRGTVTGWDVMPPARKFMNSKTRSCSLETCSFRGNYAELRKHARLEHPFERPSEASPTRKSNWIVLEQQREIEDALLHQSDMEYGDLDLPILGEWVDDDFWSGRNGLPSLDDWVEDDFWSEGSFFDILSGMSDIEDDLSLLSGLSMPFFSLYLSSHDEDMMDSGNSRSRDEIQQTAISGSRSDGHLGNATPSLESRSSSHNEDDANASRSRPDHGRENDSRENDSLNLSSRSGHRRENDRTSSRNRSSYHRADDPVSLRSRSSYSRENSSNASRSRSRYYREITPERSRSRLSHRWEDERPNSRSRSRSSYRREDERPNSRSRFYRGTFDPAIRGYGARSFPGSSSRQTRSDPGRRGD